MAKFIFRLNTNNNGQSNLKNTLIHWDDSDIYGPTEINDISSSNPSSLHEPTSIPSPFARIALAKTAFNEVADHDTKALASYQKIVSDSLDVAEIFFTFDKWKDKVEIIKWDRNKDLNELKTGHHALYKTLKTFLENDAEVYNFDKMESIYILKHKQTGLMIGATSPCTLFFSSSNDFTDIDIQLSNEHKAFNSTLPLHKRSWEFQKYLYSWIAVNNENRIIEGKSISLFKEFINYLESQKNIINRTAEIDLLTNDVTLKLQESYNLFRAPDVEVLGKALYRSNIIGIENLNVDDIFEQSIIRLPSKINNKSFFDGNLDYNSQNGYLLPLKEEFFKHFSINDVRDNIKINVEGNVVQVILKTTSNNPFIKTYMTETIKIIEDFDCFLFPNVKFEEHKNAFYRFGIFLKFDLKNAQKYSVNFFTNNNQILLDDIDLVMRNTNDPENAICKIYSLHQQSFDRITINVGNVKGVLLPTLSSKGNSEQFVFSVDFGTTNTHVEYKTNSDNTFKPFDIDESEKQIDFLHGTNDSFKLVSEIDMIPVTVGLKETFKFPIRTALSIAKNSEDTKRIYPFSQANIIIPYEKRGIPKYNETLTQLKWESNESQMSYFIDSLCFLLRNKVKLNGGDLTATKIVWFYPLSMAGSRSRIISNVWKISYAKYFLGEKFESVDMFNDHIKEIIANNLSEIPESIAPYLFYKDETKYKDAISNLVSIDIGGGTTDVVFVEEKKIEYVTSFRFAANSIFGLGENITPVVSKYQAEIKNIIDKNDQNFKLVNLYDSIKNAKHGDLASFFFSLSENEMMKNVQFSFNSLLKKDKNQKLIFILFYTAIIYHTAQIMSAKKMSLPRHITFSGNGSRIINIIANNEVLIELSKSIFEKILGQKYGTSGLDIIHNTVNPKEVTCKGGIKSVDKNYKQTPFTPLVLLGTDNTTFVSDKDTYSTINIEKDAEKTMKQVQTFVDFILDDLLNQKCTIGVVPETFIKALGLNPKTISVAKVVCGKTDDFKTYTKNGISEKMNTVDKETTLIEEPFFFYPIIPLLNALSNEINKMN